MKTVLVPIDFSPVTAQVATEAISLARLIRGRVVLLHVVEPPSALRDVLPVGEKIAPEVLLEAKKIAQERLTQWQKRLRSRFRAIELARVTGDPVTCIVEQSRKLDASYIVLGSHGHSSVYDMLVGSVAKGVQTKAACPVVVIPALTAASARNRPTIELSSRLRSRRTSARGTISLA